VAADTAQEPDDRVAGADAEVPADAGQEPTPNPSADSCRGPWNGRPLIVSHRLQTLQGLQLWGYVREAKRWWCLAHNRVAVNFCHEPKDATADANDEWNPNKYTFWKLYEQRQHAFFRLKDYSRSPLSQIGFCVEFSLEGWAWATTKMMSFADCNGEPCLLPHLYKEPMVTEMPRNKKRRRIGIKETVDYGCWRWHGDIPLLVCDENGRIMLRVKFAQPQDFVEQDD